MTLEILDGKSTEKGLFNTRKRKIYRGFREFIRLVKPQRSNAFLTEKDMASLRLPLLLQYIRF
jgi:hypothetical protein